MCCEKPNYKIQKDYNGNYIQVCQTCGNVKFSIGRVFNNLLQSLGLGKKHKNN